ncbi:3-oxoacyl-[acyl-carrier protein] reductase [Pseudoduganella flava]|uniref:3-oxoacyl-[acyl-carrier protein] reductase n=1 Tax=Pseudoduganella flava TaxID=871742 RepID=A0A562Q179_9BURK|nr:SDR family NAD(P)-dependent oxidoreductase [Pseudoduganella flava]QGZ38264.1 SDR family oxidoreductase [Pseudoduganella flava]TWI50200.1 3-oxoacyl-[acyl-carrier protein] reductase [Pseudoduganella flava]
MELQGKRALVTGGASGIGKATSLALAQAGADVVLTYWTSAAEAEETVEQIRALGRQAHAVRADLTGPEAAEQVFGEAEAAIGAIDVVFANMGGLIQRCRVADMPVALWNDAVNLNLTSTFLVCRAALRRMEPRGKGTIVTMSSLAAFDGGGPGSAHYAASKAAVATFTRALAKEVGPAGIRVNGVAPGLIATRFHDTFNTPANRQAIAERTPARREGQPDDVANVVVFLASERAAFLAGEIVQVNGGLGLY